MTTLTSRLSPSTLADAVEVATPATEFNERISALYGLSQQSNYIFGSPVGPFFHQGRHLSLPRFVYFGPHTHDESLRIAFLAGFDSADLRTSLALLYFVERLAVSPDLGQGLNLSFYPLIDVLGAVRGRADRNLAQANWADTDAPEIYALEKEARVRAYHGFVQLETGADDDVISVRLGNASHFVNAATGIELVSSEDFGGWQVRWEADALRAPANVGPLSVADDLPIRPFELSIQFPSSWNAELHREAASAILKRLIQRQRALQAYGQHL
jgi:hypothetical protein